MKMEMLQGQLANLIEAGVSNQPGPKGKQRKSGRDDCPDWNLDFDWFLPKL